ncbi:hypothetical protein GCM10009543_17680 [Leifsonia naganoensis]
MTVLPCADTMLDPAVVVVVVVFAMRDPSLCPRGRPAVVTVVTPTAGTGAGVHSSRSRTKFFLSTALGVLIACLT